MKRKLLASLAVPALAFTIVSCSLPPMGPGMTDPGTEDMLPQRDILMFSSNSGLNTRTGKLILDTPTWRATWDSLFANVAADQKPLLPDIDFTNVVVLLAAAGNTPTQLVSFRIAGVRAGPGVLEVTVESDWPQCGGLPVVTTPAHIVSVPRMATEAHFTFIDNTVSC
jgi:hypothetical protein